MSDQQPSTNPYLLPPDTASFFQSFVGRQDEVPANFQLPGHEINATPALLKVQPSIIQVQTADSSLYCSSIFVPHELTPRTGKQQELPALSPDWMIAVFSLCLLLMIICRVFFQRRVGQIFNAFLRPRHLTILIREGNILGERITPFLLLLHMLSFSLFFYLLVDHFMSVRNMVPSGMLLFLIILGSYATFYGLRSLAILLIGRIFNTHEATNSYLVNSAVMDEVLGIFLLPFSLVLIASNHGEDKTVLAIAMTLFVLVLLYRTIRNFLVGLSNSKFSWLFLFLYLCTVEILPVLAFGKLINDWLLA